MDLAGLSNFCHHELCGHAFSHVWTGCDNPHCTEHILIHKQYVSYCEEQKTRYATNDDRLITNYINVFLIHPKLQSEVNDH